MNFSSYKRRRSRFSYANKFKRSTRRRKVMPSPSYYQLKKFDGNKIGAIVEGYDYINYVAGNSSPTFNTTAAPWINITALIVGSSTWANLFPEFAYYRIREIRVECYGMIQALTPLTNPGLNQGPGPIRIAFYPNQVSTNLGTAPLYADDNFTFSGNNHNRQTFVIKIPKQFTAGPNSQGLNEWNATTNIANLFGEFAIVDQTVGTIGIGVQAVAELKFMFIMDFCHTNV